jgi:hypothetical protein
VICRFGGIPFVIPAQAGTQGPDAQPLNRFYPDRGAVDLGTLGPGFRRDDDRSDVSLKVKESCE